MWIRMIAKTRERGAAYRGSQDKRKKETSALPGK